MYPIKERKWGQAKVNTWADLSPHLWECFRVALMEATTEKEVQGVILKYSKSFNEALMEMAIQGVKVNLSPTIVSTTTEMVTNIVVSKRDYKGAMLSYLPVYERHSKVYNSIISSYDKEFRNLEQDIDIVNRNMFIDTAIESLAIDERDLGIDNISGLLYDQRREQIFSGYVSSFLQTIEETIKDIAAAYSDGKVEVNKTDITGLYEIKFIGSKGVPDNLSALKQSLETTIPAHLSLRYTYTFTTWAELKDITWDKAKGLTWKELREWEGVV